MAADRNRTKEKIGRTVVNLIPVNTADNILHLAIAAAALFAGLTSGGLMAAGRR